MQTYPAYRVAAMHVNLVFLDTDKTVDKVCSLPFFFVPFIPNLS